MSADIKLSNAQISKITQSGGFIPNMLGNLSKNVIADFAFLLARCNFKWINKQFGFKCNKYIWKKSKWKGAVRAGKGFTWFISNEDMKI